MKTNKLTGVALDWAVAKCEGIKLNDGNTLSNDCDIYVPSTDWAQGGPIIEREGIEFWTADSYQDEYGNFTSVKSAKHPASVQHYEGPNPLIAAMRCYVASKLGEEVEIPETVK